MTRALLSLLVIVASARAVLAQTPADAARPVDLDPSKLTLGTCATLDLTPGALLEPTTTAGELATPIPWSEFEVRGTLVDRKEVVHALLEPTMQQLRTSLSTATLPQLAELTARFGYQLVGHTTEDIPSGTRLVLELAPLPLVRRVEVRVDQSITDKLLEDEVRRRMGIRAGSYLPWDKTRRQCALLEERQRILEYLYDEGYFKADVATYAVLEESSATVHVSGDLGKSYKIGTVRIACPTGYERRKGVCLDPVTKATFTLAIPEADIRNVFVHQSCLVGSWGCVFGRARFTRAQFQEDLQRLKDMFHRRGFPAVRITASDLTTSIVHEDRLVNPTLTIDQRRQVFVDFEGHDRDRVSDNDLRKQLTFYDAGSADDVEANESAAALTTYLQQRGFFDAHVTWTRERVDVEPRPDTNDRGQHFDRLTFYIAMGGTRRLQRVEFVGNKELKDAQLRELVATKEAGLGGTFLGTVLAPTSAELIADQERIKEAYRRAGYPDARVYTSASPTRTGLDNAALSAALLGLHVSDDLYVRFTIDEGKPTLLSRIVIELDGGGPPSPALCAEALGALAKQLRKPGIALPSDRDKCAVTIADLKFRTDDVAATRDGLREALFRAGRARSRVEYTPVPIGPSRVEARYTVKDVDRLRLGKVVIRGNFRTRSKVIYDQLDFDEGDLLTTDRLASGARRLRNMGLFESVNLDMPDLDCEADRQCSSDVINAVVRVEERYDHRAEIALEGGYSSVNGLFGTLRPIVPNIAGRGLRFEVAGTYGQKLKDVEARFTIPPYLVRPFGLKNGFKIDLTALYRIQDTPRFGRLETQGARVDVSRAWWTRPRTAAHSAANITGGPFYDFHVRSRNVDAVRPIGADMDESQVAISTRTGAAGVRLELENRIDRDGQLSPLAPEGGMYADLSVAYASPLLLGQDRFLKVSASLSKFHSLGKYIVVRADARYDQGFPLGGAVLLPEVERFFAGGDNTVRGYADDRLATEIIQVAVPPLDNVTQIRVIPASRNIRVLGSLDMQARIWKILAGALFTDAGLLTNQWQGTTVDDIRPSVGMGLRAITPFGIGALEYAIPLRPQLGDDPRGRIHFYFAARAQF